MQQDLLKELILDSLREAKEQTKMSTALIRDIAFWEKYSPAQQLENTSYFLNANAMAQNPSGVNIAVFNINVI